METHLQSMKIQAQWTREQEYQITKITHSQGPGSWSHALKTHPESTCASGSTTCVTSWENYQGVTDEALFKLSVKIHANTARHFDQVSHFAAWFVRVSVMYVRMSQSCDHLHIWVNEIPFFSPSCLLCAALPALCCLIFHVNILSHPDIAIKNKKSQKTIFPLSAANKCDNDEIPFTISSSDAQVSVYMQTKENWKNNCCDGCMHT